MKQRVGPARPSQSIRPIISWTSHSAHSTREIREMMQIELMKLWDEDGTGENDKPRVATLARRSGRSSHKTVLLDNLQRR